MNSNSSNERFERIEAWLESASQRIDSNARAIQANTASINVIAEASGRTLRAIELLREAQEEDRVNLQEYRERTNSLNAAVERLDTIVDYLIKRDRT